ncbi:MAG: threonine/serine exporter family protein [Fusobacteriaceae bacterium]
MQIKEKINPNEVVYLANLVGKILLKSGAEAYRIEDAIIDICKHFGLHGEPFVTMTCIVCSARDEDGNLFSSVERIRGRKTNLGRIHEINELLGKLDDYTFDELFRKVMDIKEYKTFPKKIVVLGYCGGAAFFAFLFDGNIRDFGVVLVIGFLVYFVMDISTTFEINNFFSIAVASFVCAAVSVLSLRLKITTNVATPIISSLMLLVPGLSFTNSIRDLIAGDFLSGLSRGIEAIMIAASLAVGAGVALYLFV